ALVPMRAWNLRRILRQPIWFALVGAFIAGAILGVAFAHEPVSEATRLAFGRAWRGGPTETRAALLGLLRFPITILTLVLSLNAMVIKGAAYQHSPRLIPLYLQYAPVRRVIPMSILLVAYIIAAVRELGLVADDGVRARSVVSVAVFLLCVVLLFLAF